MAEEAMVACYACGKWFLVVWRKKNLKKTWGDGELVNSKSIYILESVAGWRGMKTSPC